MRVMTRGPWDPARQAALRRDLALWLARALAADRPRDGSERGTPAADPVPQGRHR